MAHGSETAENPRRSPAVAFFEGAICDATVEMKSWRATEGNISRSRESKKDSHEEPQPFRCAAATVAPFTCNGRTGIWRHRLILVKWMNDVFSASKVALDCAARSNVCGMTFRCSIAVLASADEPTTQLM
ncbi:hypothetical protein N7466_006826 [Penicillium verhagenii]|uniref:uncharacterized protein n=1 Tax=Penicillium verhagenii TaxID=1562060 RepID=UPI0025456DD2|nr:uncharacterized protein N7466_006826 [Penicillium verhagenii]KAJ5927870.1 hypothetical protein N7466_006826 [Penicillium verhagenii]